MSDFSERIVKQTEALLHFQHDETLQETTPERLHEALGQVIMMEISDNWTKTKRRQAPGRRAFYFSAEYLVGRLVYSNLFNLGILREMKAAFAEKGVDLACLEHIEDAALGNGGLGRLAACFLDSAATLDLPLMGYGLRYRYGLFKQSFVNGRQHEDRPQDGAYSILFFHVFSTPFCFRSCILTRNSKESIRTEKHGGPVRKTVQGPLSFDSARRRIYGTGCQRA